MTDTPTKPNLTLLSGKAARDVDAIADFFKRPTGRDMTEDERAYVEKRLTNPDAA